MKIGLSYIFLLIGFFSFSQSSYRFKNYTIADGLSQSSVSTIVQDKYGSLWFGTQDGLNRFDGQNFENFLSDNQDGIENSYIHTSFKDKSACLWFGTANGLTSYNPTLEKFTSFQIKNGLALQVETITEDKRGNLWLGTSSNGLCLFSKKAKTFKFFNSKIPSNKIINIQFLNAKDLLVSTEDFGLYLINTENHNVKEIPIIGKEKTYASTNPFNLNECFY